MCIRDSSYPVDALGVVYDDGACPTRCNRGGDCSASTNRATYYRTNDDAGYDDGPANLVEQNLLHGRLWGLRLSRGFKRELSVVVTVWDCQLLTFPDFGLATMMTKKPE